MILEMAWEDAIKPGELFLQWRVPCLIHAGNYIVDNIHLVKKVLAFGEFFVKREYSVSLPAHLNWHWLNHYHRAMGIAPGLVQQ